MHKKHIFFYHWALSLCLKAEGNLFKPKPVVSNNPTIKVGQTLSGKINFSKNNKNTHTLKPGQSIAGNISKTKK